MKKIVTAVALVILTFCLVQAQAPKMMNYQGVARDADGQTLVNKQINLRLSIISADDVNGAVYKEEQLVTTNEFGLFAIKIGEGTALAGSMDAIDWGSADHFISVEMDVENTGHYAFMGTSQLLSVPYAFYAETAGKATNLENADQMRTIDFEGEFGQTIRHNGSEWEASSVIYVDVDDVGLGTTAPIAKLDINGGVNLSQGNEITFGGDRALAMDANRNLMQGRQTGAALTSGVNNNMIGYRAGWKTTTGSNNSIIGYQSGFTNTTGSSNMFLGYKAGHLNTTGSNNFYGGLQAGYGSTAGQNNIALGSNAGYSIADANNNTFVGRNSGYNTTANENVFIGYEAGYDNTTGTQNTYIGTGADGSAGLTNATAIGANALVEANNSIVLGNSANVGIGTSIPQNKLHVEGGVRIVDGTQADGYVLTSDSLGNATWQTSTAIVDADGDTKIQVEESSDDDIIRFTLAGTERFVMQGGRLEVVNSDRNTLIGDDAGLNLSTGNVNTFIGYETGKTASTTNANVAVGAYALDAMTGGVANVAIGNSALTSKTSGSFNTALGYVAGLNNLTGKNNTFIGANSGNTNLGNGNIFLGYNAGYNDTLGSNRLYIENSNADSANALIYGEFDNDLLAINGTLRVNDGTQANGYVLTSDSAGNATWQASTAIMDADGDTKIQVEESADEDVIRFDVGGVQVGSVAADGKWNLVATDSNMLLGAGNNGNGGANNTFVGSAAGYSHATGDLNSAFGRSAMRFHENGEKNTAIGALSLFYNVSGSSNTAIGYVAGYNNLGSGNVFLGYWAGYNDTIGSNRLYIENSGADSANALIYGEFDNDIVRINGSLGVGTTPVNGKLEVSGSKSAFLSEYGFLAYTGVTGNITNQTNNYSIYTDDRIAATEFNAFSDRRIKNIKGISNSTDDLNTLMDIEITDYTMIDTVGEGKKQFKKVIAQQVKDVYPQAIASTEIVRAVPDIYQISSIEGGWVKLATTLKAGERVKLILADKEETVEVLETSEKGFKVSMQETGDVFVYGREVNDFHTVDYEAISMLNVSATQELAKRLEVLEKENEELKAQLLEERTSNQIRLERLEAELGIGLKSMK